MYEESRAKGSHFILGPTLNVQCSPLGRATLNHSAKDLVLSGLAAAAFLNGIQEAGIVVTAKHLVCIDQEDERNITSAMYPGRSIPRDLRFGFSTWLLGIQVPDVSCRLIIKSHGLHVSENPKSLKDLLRGEWGRKGCIMSDVRLLHINDMI